MWDLGIIMANQCDQPPQTLSNVMPNETGQYVPRKTKHDSQVSFFIRAFYDLFYHRKNGYGAYFFVNKATMEAMDIDDERIVNKMKAIFYNSFYSIASSKSITDAISIIRNRDQFAYDNPFNRVAYCQDFLAFHVDDNFF
jgi:hypothetical protein